MADDPTDQESLDPIDDHGLASFVRQTLESPDRVKIVDADLKHAQEEQQARSMRLAPWKWTVRAGAIVALGSVVASFFVAFTTQDGTDIEGKEEWFFFFLWWVPAGILVVLIGALGYAVVRIDGVGTWKRIRPSPRVRFAVRIAILGLATILLWVQYKYGLFW